MDTKERFRLTLRWLCFALLLTAAVLRLCAEIGTQGARELWQRLQERSKRDEPTVSVAAEPEETFPTMLYTPPDAPNSAVLPDAASVTIVNRAGVTLDMDALLSQPLPKLHISDEPLILIVHTHATEAYSGGDYVQSGTYHTLDTEQNVVHVGQALADKLNESGIPTLHDTTLNDALGYDDAYERTAEVIARYLEQYPSIQMVIDVHRDAITDTNGEELAMRTELNGQSAAQLLFVMGTDTAGLEYPNWEGNLAFALQIQAYCTSNAPNLFRELSLRSARYNEHLTPYSVLLEVGSAGNTLDEAIRSVDFFGTKLAELLKINSES